jgi:hypothetical protein
MLDQCVLYGGIIAVVVSLLKRIPFIRNNPKVIAAILAAASAVWQTAHPGTVVDWTTLVQCFAAQFAGSVATYETVIQPVRKSAESKL